jgi:RNA polymerase sigma-70 factor (ECF subfamily)
MMRLLDTKTLYDERPPTGVELTRREQELLAAWERSNVPDDLDEAYELRLLAAYHAMPEVSLEALESIDREVVERMRAECEAGPSAATSREFHRLAKQHDVYLRRVAFRLSGDMETAKDLVQDTLARALIHFDQFEQGTNARGWLVTILTRLYYDMIKHARVISKAQDDLTTLAPLEYEDSAPSIADAQLWDAVEALEPDLRGVVERCYVHDMSYKAIADELKVPVGTIGTRLRRARERLRALLSRDTTSA